MFLDIPMDKIFNYVRIICLLVNIPFSKVGNKPQCTNLEPNLVITQIIHIFSEN